MARAIVLPLVCILGHATIADAASHLGVKSPGCTASIRNEAAFKQANGPANHEYVWAEQYQPNVTRSVAIYVPPTVDHSKPVPIIWVLHGHGMWGAASLHSDAIFKSLADRDGWILAYPMGMWDCEKDACKAEDLEGNLNGKPSWNAVGSAEKVAGRQACDKSVQTLDMCYESCKRRPGGCDQCFWSTCTDDIGFMKAIMAETEKANCIDMAQIYGYGCSNGGMFAHEIVQSMPGKFKAITATCGGKPHRGWENDMPKDGPATALLQITGANDIVIPYQPFVTAEEKKYWDGFLYVSDVEIANVYKSYNKCTNTGTRPYESRFALSDIQCTEVGWDCSSSVKVVRCVWQCQHDKCHDLYLSKGDDQIHNGPQMAWDFFNGTSNPTWQGWKAPAPTPAPTPALGGATAHAAGVSFLFAAGLFANQVHLWG